MYFVIGKNNCPFCDKAKAMLDKDNTAYVYKNLDTAIDAAKWRDFVIQDLGMRTVPVVLKVGTIDNLKEWLNE